MFRLATARAEIAMVNDHRGGPTYAPHLANASLDVAARIAAAYVPPTMYHCNLGEASVGGVAASRLQNSRLNTDKLTRNFDVQLPDWRTGLRACVARLVAPGRRQSALHGPYSAGI